MLAHNTLLAIVVVLVLLFVCRSQEHFTIDPKKAERLGMFSNTHLVTMMNAHKSVFGVHANEQVQSVFPYGLPVLHADGTSSTELGVVAVVPSHQISLPNGEYSFDGGSRRTIPVTMESVITPSGPQFKINGILRDPRSIGWHGPM